MPRLAADCYGTVFRRDTVTNMARLVGANGAYVTQAQFGGDESSSGECGVPVGYSIYLLDDQDADARTEIAGHQNVGLDPADVIFDALQTDDLWEEDDTGYNFRHRVPVNEYPAFEIAGRRYLVEYVFCPLDGERFMARFRLDCI